MDAQLTSTSSAPASTRRAGLLGWLRRVGLLIVAVVLTWRLFQFWTPIPIALLTYVWLRITWHR